MGCCCARCCGWCATFASRVRSACVERPRQKGLAQAAAGFAFVAVVLVAFTGSALARTRSMSWLPARTIDPVGRLQGLGAYLTGISCPSVTLCVAVDDAGNVVASRDPASGASSWHVAAIDNGQMLMGVSCASSSLCVAVDERGAAFTSSDPSSGAASWRRVATGASQLSGVSCPSMSLCVAVGGQDAYVTKNPAAQSAAWISTDVESTPCSPPPPNTDYSYSCPPNLLAVSCPSATLCVAADDDGNVVSSEDPTSGSGAWNVSAVDQGSRICGVGLSCHNGLVAVTCDSTSLCPASDNSYQLFVSSTATSGSSKWSVLSSTVNVTGISCASASLCVAVGGQDAATSADPSDGAGSWRSQTIEQNQYLLEAVSCASAWLCVAVDNNGHAVTGLATPELTKVHQSHRVWTTPGASRARHHSGPVGTVFSFVSNEPVAVELTFTTRHPGRRVNNRCVRDTPPNATNARCFRQIRQATIQVTAHPGMNRYHFLGRISHSKMLSAGAYVVAITAKNPAGGQANPKRLQFTIT